jgi:hypothetical protein
MGHTWERGQRIGIALAGVGNVGRLVLARDRE